MNRPARPPSRLNASLKSAALALVACGVLTFLPETPVWSAGAAGKGDKSDKQVDFAKDVVPILKASCVKCHSADPNNPRKRAAGGLRLDDKAAAFKGGKAGKDIVPGSAKDSLVYTLLLGPVTHGGDEIAAMPKARRGEQFKALPQEQIDTVKAWIDQGAKWPD